MTGARSRYAGLAAVATLWLSLGAAARRSGFPLLGDRPLSAMTGDPASSVLFSAGLVASAVMLMSFHGHVRARYRVSTAFSVAMLGGMACQVVAGIVPIDGGTAAHRLHTSAALTLGASLPLLMWRFASEQPSGSWRRVAYGLFWTEAAACVAGVVLSSRSVAPLAEILPAGGFHLWIAVLTLYGPDRPARPGPGPTGRRRASGRRSATSH